MSSNWGNQLKLSVFGESHGAAIGVVIDGLPAGEEIDLEQLLAFSDRRRPGKNRFSTPR
ncbi:MAG: chorismate synthase, partial [Oscillospiraceae bacterium]|nr:chorismate synthase [Oscillospiraceae bacterium]